MRTDAGPTSTSSRPASPAVHERVRWTRHDRGLVGIPLVDLERASGAVAQEHERLPHRVVERRLRRPTVGGPGEVEQDAQGTLHLQRRLPHEPQAGLVVRARRCVFEEEVDEAEDPVERVRDVVRDAGRELAERGGAGRRNELALDLGTPIVRKRQYC